MMTLREEIQARIAQYDDAMLLKLSEQLNLLEEKSSLESDEFVSMVREIKAHNRNADPDELTRVINEAVRGARSR